MNSDRLIDVLKKKLEQIPSLQEADTENLQFKQWRNSVKATLEHMGKRYEKRIESLDFYPNIVIGTGDNGPYRRAYLRGLDDAQALLEALIEELELFGYEGENKKFSSAEHTYPHITLNVSMSQQQTQQLKESIEFEHYSVEVQEKIQQLLDELKHTDKDKVKISSAIKWLANKSVDALIAILLASTNLTK